MSGLAVTMVVTEPRGRLNPSVAETTPPTGTWVRVSAAASCGHCAFCRVGDVVHCPDRKVPGLSYPGGWAQSITVPRRRARAHPRRARPLGRGPVRVRGRDDLQRRTESLRYRHGHDNRVRSYTLDPYGLVNKAGVWYLIADHRGEPALFRTDRALSATVLDEPVRHRDGLELADVWDRLRRHIDDIPAPLPVTVRRSVHQPMAAAVPGRLGGRHRLHRHGRPVRAAAQRPRADRLLLRHHRRRRQPGVPLPPRAAPRTARPPQRP